jgi:8-oxo-dGTP pyrophosphatase MutT (NUDIX family)
VRFLRPGTHRAGLAIAAAVLAMALLLAGCFGGGGDNTTTTKRGGSRAVATVLLLRSGTQRLEVLLVKHGTKTYLSPNTWVLPGGAIDPSDDSDQAAQSAGAKAVSDQAGIDVDPSALVPYADWVALPFVTHFYLAPAPADAQPKPDGSQTVEASWFDPKQALNAHDAGDMPMTYTTAKQLESLTGFSSATDALDTARHTKVEPVHLRIVGKGDKKRAVLPKGQP